MLTLTVAATATVKQNGVPGATRLLSAYAGNARGSMRVHNGKITVTRGKRTLEFSLDQECF